MTFLRIVYIMCLGPSAYIHKSNGMTAILKGEWIGLFMENVFISQFDDGKQFGLKCWTRMVHTWRVDEEMGDNIFNF
jgi:hypothetical protein